MCWFYGHTWCNLNWKSLDCVLWAAGGFCQNFDLKHKCKKPTAICVFETSPPNKHDMGCFYQLKKFFLYPVFTKNYFYYIAASGNPHGFTVLKRGDWLRKDNWFMAQQHCLIWKYAIHSTGDCFRRRHLRVAQSVTLRTSDLRIRVRIPA